MEHGAIGAEFYLREPNVINVSLLKYNFFLPLVVQMVNALRAKDTSCRYVFTDIYALRAKKL
jgi:hypothetical protein